MDDITLLEELEKRFYLPTITEDDITALRMAAKWNMSHRTAKDRLDALVKAGKMETYRIRLETGQPVTAYRIKITASG
ncbi:hypothetical protein CCP3SC15_1930002 [Gammaproteobacteria bacterium]